MQKIPLYAAISNIFYIHDLCLMPETCLTTFVVSCCSGLLNIMQHWHQSVL